MTEWEKKRMSTAPQDCLRTFRLNPEAPGGWSEYGETMLDFESTETLTEDNGKAKIALLKAEAVAPLPCGTFLRMYLFGQISDGVPVWQTDGNGEPKNYRNYYVTSANSRWFERNPNGRVDRYKHEYDAQEIIACLKDYPIRSTKTFAEGAYTFGECLDIAFTLAFRPRSVGNYAYSIKDFPGLNEPNSKLEYTNATLYDVVTDIGRIIDAVPSMEIVFADGVYTFELRFTDRYGLEGEVHDISYFNNKINDAVNVSRDTNAGACISNVENLITKDNSYPNTAGIMPADTNLEKSWGIFELPYPIDTVSNVKVFWEYDMDKDAPSGAGSSDVILYTRKRFNSYRRYSSILFRNPIVIKPEGTCDDDRLYKNDGIAEQLNTRKKLFIRNYEDYLLLADVDNDNTPTQRNTIYYTRGDNKIYLQALFNNVYRYWYSYSIAGSTSYEYARFSESPNETVSHNGRNNNKFYVSITFKGMLNGVIKGANSKLSDVTVFFNQQGQVVDIQSFGTAVNNYTKTMNGESRVVAHYYNRIGREAMYAEMPKIGSSVIDKERDKRYVITLLSFTRKMHGGQYLAYMTESRGGKSRYIIADNRRAIYAIPSNNIVDSKSHTHILCKMGIRAPFSGTSSTAIAKEYLFNAFMSTQHGMETIPNTVDLGINAGDTINLFGVNIFNSRIRLSVLMTFRMMANSLYIIQNGDPVLYTDTNGQLESIHFQYKAGDTVAVDFSQTLKKDAYEILNHTTQVSWVEYGNLRIGEPLIDMSYFGNGDGLSDALELVLLSSRMRLNDDITQHTAGRYSITAIDTGISYDFTISGMNSIPEHVGWAIVRGNSVVLLDNFDNVIDNVIKVYYSIEVIA